MKPIIRAIKVTKQYKIGSAQNSYITLRDTFTEVVRTRLQGFKPVHVAKTLFALRNVTFEVVPGEVLGIIGRNGAGKSTLLKVLARITEPSSGRIELRGRVASLLEVGTGFHPELTGRENIYLNGALLGMARSEIQRKFDEIVAFSEMEQFLDTPVKRYSSGMYLKLAFAVAAHLNPEILLVDEMLAVGDARFQRKCLDKMEHVREAGRTVIFVSHNMSTITRLCSRTILLENGSIRFDGPSHQSVAIYLGVGTSRNAEREWKGIAEAPGNEIVRLRAVRVRAPDAQICESVDISRPVAIEMEFEVRQGGHVLVPGYHFINQEGVCAFVASEYDLEWHRRPRPAGRFISTAMIPANFLAEGALILCATMATMDPFRLHFFERDVVAFHVVDSFDGNATRGDYAGPMPGVVRPLLKWTSEFIPENSPAIVGEPLL